MVFLVCLLESSCLLNGRKMVPFVASLLELARLIVDSSWIPPQPIIFLFNGAEELFLLVRCMKNHSWYLFLYGT